MNLISAIDNFLHRILGNELDFDLKKYLIKGSFYSVLIQVFSMGLNFLIGVMIARLVGAGGYGTFTYAFTLLSVICTVSSFGIDDLLVREVSSFQSQGNFSAIKTIVKWAVKRALLFSALITVGFFIAVNFSDLASPEKTPVLNMILAGIPALTLIMVLQAVHRGLHRVVTGQLPEKIIRPVAFAIIILLLFLFNRTFFSEPAGIVIQANIMAFLIALLVLAFQTIKVMKQASGPGETKAQQSLNTSQKTWLKSSFYFFIATIVAAINVRADILMLGWMKTDTEVGIYNVAARFSDFTAFALLIITPIIAPSISRLFSLNEKVKLQQLVSKMAKANFIFAVAITLILAVGGEFFLGIFGSEFTAGYYATLLLCSGHLATTFAGPAGNILLMSGYEKLAFYCGLTGTVINIGLNLLLIPGYGINGAAAATAISLLVWNGMQTFFVFKHLKINPTVIS